MPILPTSEQEQVDTAITDALETQQDLDNTVTQTLTYFAGRRVEIEQELETIKIVEQQLAVNPKDTAKIICYIFWLGLNVKNKQ